MKSRWTDFLTTDGEKISRKRDDEFEMKESDKDSMLLWEEGWDFVFKAIDALKNEDLGKYIRIRNEEIIVIDAINRQLTHYAYHIGQIVYAAKQIKGKEWVNLSIPKNRS